MNEGSESTSSGRLAPTAALLVITDFARYGRAASFRALEAAVGAGLGWVQLREPGAPESELEELAREVRRRWPWLSLALNCRPDDDRLALARRLELDGLHLGGGRLEAIDALRAQWEGPLGYSAHGIFEAEEAVQRGADYVSLAPIWSPRSKSSSRPALGIEILAAATRSVGGRLYALGGVDAGRAAMAHTAGAAGVALIGALFESGDAARLTREVLAPWRDPSPRDDLS